MPTTVIPHKDQHEKAGFDTVKVDVTSDALNLPYVDVREHGAKCDGTTDDTVAVQAAIDASAGARTVLFPSLTCLCAGQLTIPANTSLRGVSSNESILKFNFTLSAAGAYISNADGDGNITIENLRIEGNGTGLPEIGGNSGILFRSPTDLTISNCQFYRIPASTINLRSPQNVIITNNSIVESGRGGIHLTSPQTVKVTRDIVISNNILYRIGDDGISVFASETSITNTVGRPTRVAITGNKIMGWDSTQSNATGTGIIVGGVEDVTISGNVISQTASRGISIEEDIDATTNLTSRRVVVSGNTIRQAGFHNAAGAIVGIDVSGSTNVVVNGNIVSEGISHGIRVAGFSGKESTSDVTISNNNVFDNTGTNDRWAIFIQSGAVGAIDRVQVLGNTVVNNNGGGIRSQGADNVLISTNLVVNNGNAQSGPTDVLAAGLSVTANGFAGVNVIVKNNRSYDDRGASQKQTYGLSFPTTAAAVATAVIEGNALHGNETASLDIVQAPTTLRRFNNWLTSADLGVLLPGVAFANLGTPADGTVVYCSNCARGSTPCTGGTGAFAKRENGVWNCD